MKALADEVEGRAQPALVVLAGSVDGRAIAVCKASKAAQGADAGAIVRAMSKILGGGGGGGKGFAQGGGPDATKVDAALAEGRRLARAALGSP
jgi:alanyl-tRNA synthetase